MAGIFYTIQKNITRLIKFYLYFAYFFFYCCQHGDMFVSFIVVCLLTGIIKLNVAHDFLDVELYLTRDSNPLRMNTLPDMIFVYAPAYLVLRHVHTNFT